MQQAQVSPPPTVENYTTCAICDDPASPNQSLKHMPQNALSPDGNEIEHTLINASSSLAARLIRLKHWYLRRKRTGSRDDTAVKMRISRHVEADTDLAVNRGAPWLQSKFLMTSFLESGA
eukprot:TRINITY_DN16519_c2_g1_i1.p3 TRINITY_DN16519_c2_g1~~TRINITY_DN16519_c2_g1_i1.p3  ORF type:complete len:120 (+),score=7.20 TRINITY_DN16519_c2_g1_i1:150-509(+)